MGTYYHSSEKLTKTLGRAGKLNVDLITSTVTFLHEDCVLEGERMPMNIVHIYNERTKGDLNLKTPSDSTFEKRVGMGKGWRTNLNRYVFATQETVDGESKNVYVYVDHLAEEHTFRKYDSQTELYFNGETVLYVENDTIVIRDKTGGKMIFDASGKLTKIFNDRGSVETSVMYTAGTDRIATVKSGDDKLCSFVYADLTINGETQKMLSQINYSGVVYSEFIYDSNGLLVEIRYPSATDDTDAVNNKTTFEYEVDDDLSAVRDRTGKYLIWDSHAEVGAITIGENTNVSSIKDGVVTMATQQIRGEQTKITYKLNETLVSTQDGRTTVCTHQYSGAFLGKCVIKDYVDGVKPTESQIESMQANGAEVNMHADNLYANGNFETLPQGVIGCTLENNFSFMGNSSLAVTLMELGQIPIGATNSKGAMVSFMYWMGRTTSGIGECKLKVKVKYRDGTEETGDEINLNAEADCWQPMIVPIGKNYVSHASEIDGVWLLFDVNETVCYIDFLRVIENEFVIVKSETDEECIVKSETQKFKVDDISTIYYEGGSEKSAYNLSVEDLKFMTLCKKLGRPIPLVANKQNKDTTTTDVNKKVKLKTDTGVVCDLDDFKESYKVIEINKNGKEITNVILGEGGDKNTIVKNYDSLLMSNTVTNNEYNQPATVVDYNGIKTEYVYNNYGNVVKETKTAGNKSISYDYAYSNNGNFLTKTHDGRGTSNFDSYTTEYTYDTTYPMLSEITEPLNKITSFTYDLENRLKQLTSHGAVTEYSYTRGLLTKIVFDSNAGVIDGDSPKSEITIEYDGFGDILAYYIDNVKIVWYNYKKDSDYSSTDENTFNYVIVGEQYSPAYGRKSIFAKDGNLICVKKGTFNYRGEFVADKEILRITYDQRGRVSTITDNSTSTPQTYTYTYKADGSVDKITKGGFANIEVSESVLEEYVNLIKFSKYNSASGSYIYEYLKVNDRIKSLTTPSGKTTEYTYDEFNRIKLKETLFPDGLVEPDLLSTRFNYDKDFLTSIQHKSLDDTVNEYYDYDECGNIVRYVREKVNPDGTALGFIQFVDYKYDNFNQLVREDNQGLNYTRIYTYDLGGNIDKVYEYDYTTSTVPEENKFRYKDTYTYGDYGSMHKNCLHLVYRSTDMESLGNVVDGWEMVESYTRHSFHNGNIGVFDHGRLTSYGDFQMEYDINGIRQSKTHTVTDGDIYTTGSQTDTVTTHTYYTENNVIHKEVVEVKKIEKGFEDRIYPDGSVLEDYFERETILSTKTFTYFYDESGICGLNYNEKNYYFQKNAFGDVVRIYGPDALLVAEYVYDAWGNHKIFDKDGLEITNSDHIESLNPFRYRGYYYDTDLKFYYLESRYYCPKICRFISPDEFDYLSPTTIGGLNLYTYCGNNPVMRVDPSGRDWLEWLITIVATIVAASLIVVGTILSGGALAILGSVMVGAGSGFLFGAGANIISQGISSNWDWGQIDPIKVLEAGGIGAMIGAVSGFASGYLGSVFEFSGQLFGSSLGKANIAGMNVGKAFASFGGTQMITKTFAFFGKTVGAFTGGVIANKYANQWFGKHPTADENILESISSIFWDNAFSAIYKVFKWI